MTAQLACDDVYRAYGQRESVTNILRAMKRDEMTGKWPPAIVMLLGGPPKNEATTQFPCRFHPNQRVCLLIVMSVGGGIKRNGQNCPCGAKMATVAYPPNCTKSSIPPS